MRRMMHTEARGPVYARALGHQLRPSEANLGFCLQVVFIIFCFKRFLRFNNADLFYPKLIFCLLLDG